MARPRKVSVKPRLTNLNENCLGVETYYIRPQSKPYCHSYQLKRLESQLIHLIQHPRPMKFPRDLRPLRDIHHYWSSYYTSITKPEFSHYCKNCAKRLVTALKKPAVSYEQFIKTMLNYCITANARISARRLLTISVVLPGYISTQDKQGHTFLMHCGGVGRLEGNHINYLSYMPTYMKSAAYYQKCPDHLKLR